jgi:uncharacterized ion transporter superfamily protein YfcC
MALWGGIAKRQIAAGVAVFLWAVFLYFGVKISSGAASQGIDGLPSSEQLALYVWIPAAMVLCSLVLTLVGKRISVWMFLPIYFVLMAALLPVFLLFGGGV